ncbi:Hypothetical predicted protein [Octopus vulgaris]|nr:Hypothetical predicted protein [Octopus vulgaris]
MTAMVGALEIILGLGTSVVAPNLLFLMFSLGIISDLYTAYNNNNYDYSILILAVLTTASALPIFIFYICTCRKTKAVILDHHQHTEDASTIKKIAA